VSLLARADLRTLWLLGRPVGHSLSPLIQNTALQAMRQPVVYLAAEVAEDRLEAALRGLLALGALGANLTVPHKEAAYGLCDSLSPRARAMKACNVLKFAAGKIHGDNTDGDGWLRGLEPQLGGSLPAKALVIGAGGAARAVVYSLARRRVPEIVVLNRTFARAQALAGDFQLYALTRTHAAPLEDFPGHLHEGCLVVQTTSAGLDGEAPVPLPRQWPPGVVLSELIYGRETPLAARVRALGGRAFDGLPMLVEQAAESLSLWLERPLPEIPSSLMMEAARRHLAGSA
jgi:shikimate dehydrogenase